eukprot:TRINITY_DN7634_c0_g2_i3.p1 TRINITY_DN7634_c0_g2~~TRINITY_DN7634_c0_g2_i3.p1  ORF type:complete len:273 (-),score=7.77 TRINITY_DN7634_c0_g2_i3:274-1020(-)
MQFFSYQFAALIAPILCYWIVGGIYELLDRLDCLQQYRLHTKEEASKRNQVSKWKVVLMVFSQQVGQVILGLIIMDEEDNTRPNETVFDIILQVIVGMLVMDGWQYTIHRLFHEVPALYKSIHSWHHQLYVPYAFGALFNHPLEGFLMDTAGAGLSFFVAGMSNKTAAFFFTFSTYKTLMDHCGYRWPINPMYPFFENNASYHDVHHQPYGIKKNYCQPYFTVWDRLFGSYEAPAVQFIGGKQSMKVA